MRHLNLNFKNKKSNAVVETITVLVVLFVFAFAAIYGFRIMSTLNEEIQADADFSTEGKEIMDSTTASYPSWFDGGFLFVFILLWIAVLIGAFWIDTHPIFFIVTILLLMFIMYLGMVLSNNYTEVMESDDMITYSDQFPITNFIFNNMFIVVSAVGVSIALVMFAKMRAL